MATKKAFFNSLLSEKKSPIINKYNIALFVFCIWIGFVDKYSIVNQFKLTKNVNKLESAKSEYERLLEEALAERDIINSDIEKYAREKYLFHKDNEEVILIR